MNANTCTVYRLNERSLAQRITTALEHYSVHNGGLLPAAVKVNPKDAPEAAKVVESLGLALPVVGNGGALLGEVWLQAQNGGETK